MPPLRFGSPDDVILVEFRITSQRSTACPEGDTELFRERYVQVSLCGKARNVFASFLQVVRKVCVGNEIKAFGG